MQYINTTDEQETPQCITYDKIHKQLFKEGRRTLTKKLKLHMNPPQVSKG